MEVENRREALSKIIAQFQKERKIINRFTLQPALKEAGFDVSEGTIYRDMTVINRSNTWVKDLVESNYSALQENIASMLDIIEKEAYDNYKKTWTTSKTTKKQVPRKDGTIEITEETKTGELAGPKATFLNILTRVQELRMKHTHGDNINISAALLTAELQEAKDKLESQSSDGKTPIVNVIELAKKAQKNGMDN